MYVGTADKEWEQIINDYDSYQTVKLKDTEDHNHNGSDYYKIEYENTSSSAKEVTVKIKLFAESCINSPNNPSRTIPWESDPFIVPAPPELLVNTTSLDFGKTEQHEDLPIANTGGDVLHWVADPSEDWITLAEEEGTLSGGNSFPNIVTVTRGNIPRAERDQERHTGVITISAEDNSQNNIGTATVDVSADIDAPPAPQNLTLSHSGTFSNPQLAWSESALFYRYHIERNTAGTGWMEIATTTGTAYTDTDAFVDTQSGDDIQYRVCAWNGAGFSGYSNTASVDGYAPYKIDTTDEHFALTVSEILPDEYALGHCYPNPGNPGTSVRFQLPEEGHADIRIYNIRGETVRTLFSGQKQAGFHRIDWDGRTNAGAIAGTGLYIIVLHAGGRTFNTKYTLIK